MGLVGVVGTLDPEAVAGVSVALIGCSGELTENRLKNDDEIDRPRLVSLAVPLLVLLLLLLLLLLAP